MKLALLILLLATACFGQGLTLRSPLRDIAPVATASGPPAFVAETIATTGGLITSPWTVTVTTAASAGNTVAVGIESSNLQGDIATVVDSKGNSYTSRVTANGGSNRYLWIYSSTLATSLTTSDTITITWNSAALAYLGIGAASFSGVTGVDVSATGSDENASTVAAAATTTVANTAIYGILQNLGHTYASGNFNAIGSADRGSGHWFYTMQKDYSSTGSKDIGGTCQIFQGWTTAWVAFK